ncbi:hypothetical protein [Cyclobacterium roseum]|uniref:hypothetical protein n=1 Tax=Cyclobacterium roseum TaxID=2666137 RepID=UPI0013918CE1|nr:hypothetical protein [Cyclobacterium roseum]
MAGLVVLISSVFFSIENPLERVFAVGGGAILLGLVIVSSYGGTLIDFSGKRTKDYYSICGFKFGDWTALPAILTVEVISAHKRISNTPNGISPTLSGNVIEFETLLYSTASLALFSFVYLDRDKTIDQAQKLAAGLNADLVLRIP